jgi:6,7-dimethyl-8-ribityllumazine synthase
MEIVRPPYTFHFDEPPHVMIIEAPVYPEIGAMQMRGAKNVLARVNATSEVVTVPGALEIPAAIAFALKSLDFDPVRRRSEGFIVLGCVVKGETIHDEIIGFEVTRSLQDLAATRSLAIGNGLIVCKSMQQAVERADPARLNRGADAAEACLRMLELKHKFRLSPKRRWVAQK